jgi:hypothetical protein
MVLVTVAALWWLVFTIENAQVGIARTISWHSKAIVSSAGSHSFNLSVAFHICLSLFVLTFVNFYFLQIARGKKPWPAVKQ